jgi:hypothetical protein
LPLRPDTKLLRKRKNEMLEFPKEKEKEMLEAGFGVWLCWNVVA